MSAPRTSLRSWRRAGALERGARVRVLSTGALGTVAWIAFAPPDYRRVARVGVRLDARRRRGYFATAHDLGDLEVVAEEVS